MARGSKKPGAGSRAGFTYPEMAFLLLVLALFLGGTVWVASGAVVKSHPFRKSEGAGKEGEAAMNKIAALVKSARRFYCERSKSERGGLVFASESLDFLADLDSDSKTGSYRTGDTRGLERVLIARAGASVTVSVHSSPAASPSVVVLTSDLPPGDGGAFKTELQTVRGEGRTGGDGSSGDEGGRLVVSGVRVTITTGNDRNRLVVSRDIGTSGRPPLDLGP